MLHLDEHSLRGSYLVRSLYFDTVGDDAVSDKLGGTPFREKFRLRCYNHDFGFLRFEKKVKCFNKGYKLEAALAEEEARRLVAGDIGFLKESPAALLREFYLKCRFDLQQPKVIIEYDREAYIYKPGNTRITLDYNIKASVGPSDFFDLGSPLVTIEPHKCVLEVKFDRYLPDLVRDLIQVSESSGMANSKYLSGRMMSV